MCWRPRRFGFIEILLITSKTTGRWVIPKGNLKLKESQKRLSKRLVSQVASGKTSVGRYYYFKRERARFLTVSIYPLRVDKEAKMFPEVGVRRRC